MLDFRNLTFASSNLRVRAIMPPHSKFRLNGTIWSRVIAKKMIFNMVSEFLSRICRPAQNFRLRTRFRQIRTILS